MNSTQKRIESMENKLKELGQEEFLKSLNNSLPKKNQKNLKSEKKLKKLNRLFDNAQYAKIAFRLSYVGIDYLGLESQQDNPKTIEFHLFNAFEKLSLIKSREDCDYCRAGRTDKGVSAIGNVISLNIRKLQNINELEADRINRLLPEDIRIIDQKEVDSKFSARYNCIKRIYKYYFYKELMNIELMKEACQLFLGEHDFRYFCKLDVIANQNFIRTIYNIEIELVTDPFQPKHSQIFLNDERLQLYCITIEGNAFLWHQIRCITQILFLIGRGKEDKTVITKLLTVDENVGKPQYELAPGTFFNENKFIDYQLVLYDCLYPNEQLNFSDQEKGQFFTKLQLSVYNMLRNKLSGSYIKHLIFNQIGCEILNKKQKQIQQLSIENDEAKLKNAKQTQSILQSKRSETVKELINNLKGKRKEMYDLKMLKVQEYQMKLNQIQESD